MQNATPPYREIEFNAFDPRTRQRLIDAFLRKGHPMPLAFRYEPGGGIFGWLFLSVLGMLGLLFLSIIGFASPYAFHQDACMMVGYAMFFFLPVWGVMRALRTRARGKAVPFKRGRYLFASDIVIATESKLRIVPLSFPPRIEVVHRLVNGRYVGTDLNFYIEGHGRETFTIFGKENAERVYAELRYGQEQLSQAFAEQNGQVLAAYDPFVEARQRPEWNDPAFAAHRAQQPELSHAADTTLSRPMSGLLARAALASLPFMLFAPPYWFVRNFVSDEAAFAKARQRDDVYDYEGYVRHHGRHEDEVRNRWLPEAAFAEARREGTVTALREFTREYPQSPRVADARTAIHERFVRVRQDFMSQAATTDPAMPVFMGELLDWLEAHDSPTVQVRFFAPSADSLALIDRNLELLARTENVTGGIAPVSPHFTPERSEARERNITRVLENGFQPVFPREVMELEHLGRIDAAAQNAPLTQPVMDVSYLIRPSGSVYTSDTSQRGFVGIHVDFHIQMRIPGSARTWGFNTSVEPPEHFTVRSERSYDQNDPHRDGLVYSVMADRAFDQLENRLALAFFRAGSPAYERANQTAQTESP